MASDGGLLLAQENLRLRCCLRIAKATRENVSQKSLLQQVVEELPEATKLRYVPVLVSGTRERMAPAVLRAIFNVFGTLYSRRGTRSDLEGQIENLLSKPDNIKDGQVIELIEKANLKLSRMEKVSECS